MHHILIVEDSPEYQQWLVGVLSSNWPGSQVHLAASLRASRTWLALAPDGFDLALVDLLLPDGSGSELIAEIRQQHPRAMTVISTIFDDDAHLFGALAAGAQGYLLKDLDETQLLHHLETIAAGAPPISPAIARRILAHFRDKPLAHAAPHLIDDPEQPALTPRELEVLRYIGRGLRVMETARLMNLTEHTVAGYVKSLYRKLNVSSRAETALEAARRGLV
ncbi:MAG: response regulator [Pigmentiphaga sp.]